MGSKQRRLNVWLVCMCSLGGWGGERLRLDGAGDRMMMGADQSPKLFS